MPIRFSWVERSHTARHNILAQLGKAFPVELTYHEIIERINRNNDDRRVEFQDMFALLATGVAKITTVADQYDRHHHAKYTITKRGQDYLSDFTSTSGAVFQIKAYGPGKEAYWRVIHRCETLTHAKSFVKTMREERPKWMFQIVEVREQVG